ncbi:MAG: sigma-54-dependent Fis family transcriptional regulator [Sandaracinaceae bacterium]|nr:sigma-54-dependent Fis family transcriptional regulator [Sandaracinaceae bacterium]
MNANSTDNPRGRILVVDDEASARSALQQLLTLEGYEVEAAADGRAALLKLATFEPDVVLTDLKMPGIDGLTLVEQGRVESPHSAFLVMTAFGSVDSAVAAIRLGAENYLTKPLDMDAVTVLVERAVEHARLRRDSARLREQLGQRLDARNLIGDHPTMQRLFKTMAQVAKSNATVLVHGETGTGKELIAAAIHRNSPRSEQPFVKLNCAALAESVLESELFGHERGAFTGALQKRRGRFESAHGGTLFLDEVSEIPMSVQVKLLRFLQEKDFERVGGNETVRVNVRVVAATNRDLLNAVEDGTFREDLYYRLNVVQLEVPPLRVRRTDIPLLAHHFLERYAKDNDRHVVGFTDAALRALVGHSWPGNVRELENAIERAVVLTEDEEIGEDAFPLLRRTPKRGSGAGLDDLIPGITMAELERLAIERTLAAVGGSTAKAAEMLDMSRRTLQHRMKQWREDGSESGSEGDGDGDGNDSETGA